MCPKRKIQNFYRQRIYIYWSNFLTSKRKRRGSCGDMCVAKIIACVLIASILMESVTAAPVQPDESVPTQQKPKINKNPHQRRKGIQNANGKKSNERRRNQFSDTDVEAWKNACASSVWEQPAGGDEKFEETSYETTKSSLELSAKTLIASMARTKSINTTNFEIWEEFKNETYKFLPLKPTGLAQKWHLDVQVYTASLSLLKKYQEKKDEKENSNQESKDLQEILKNARSLLCDIEHFVNATSNKNGKNKPYWYEKGEMAKIVTFRRRDHMLNNIFVKARLQTYVERLQKRLENFKLEKNLETKALRPHRGRAHQKRNRKNKLNRQRTTTEAYTGEPTSSPKTFIITTKKPRRNTKVQRRQGNKINQKLQ